MLNAGSKHLVVIAPGDRFVGVLGGRELIAVWANSPDTFASTPVTAALDSVAATVAPSARVHTVARVMRDFRSDVVVVVGQNRVAVGVVTAGDLLAGIADGG